MQKRKYLTTHEVERILYAVSQGRNKERDYCLIKMCFMHGLRVSELCHLKLSDLDIEGRTILIRRLKRSLSTIHPLFEDEYHTLKTWLAVRRTKRNADCEWLFLSQKGGSISRQQVRLLLKEYGLKAGLDIVAHPHMLRHGCGYALANMGKDTRLIQDFLGHINIRHTVLYTTISSQRFIQVWKNDEAQIIFQ